VRYSRFSRKRQEGSEPIFFQDLGKNTCLLQLALKALHPTFKAQAILSSFLRSSKKQIVTHKAY